ncbi:MAG: hypothetical protein RBT61_07210 [Candidatus Kapabacteria bacterium]|jgi:hypothetical protein|nr:hypothetical protein [Candidatus Kapabacteria bacterium]
MTNKLKYHSMMLVLFVMSLPLNLMAQDDIDPHPADDDPTPATPIDSELIYLLIAGIFLALLFFIYKKKKTTA